MVMKLHLVPQDKRREDKPWSFKASDDQDIPMPDANTMDDDDAPQSPASPNRYDRKYLILRDVSKAKDIVDTYRALVALRQYHLLQSFKKSKLLDDDQSWDRPKAGMQGATELINIATNLKVCNDQVRRAEEIMRLAHNTINTHETHGFVTVATDKILKYLRRDHKHHARLAAGVRLELKNVKEMLVQATLEEDDLVSEESEVLDETFH